MTEQQPHSCVTCQRRKVKCERRHPCSNCVKHGSVCEFRAPAPPRRRKRQSPGPDVYVKLKRAEELLQGYGIDLDHLSNDQLDKPQAGLNSETTRIGAKDGVDTSAVKPAANQRPKCRLQSSTSATVSEEFQHLEELLEGSDEEPNKTGPGIIQKAYDVLHGDGSGLLFGFSNKGDLKRLHPPAINIFRLWQTYLSSVYPLTMVFHAPTIQQQILEATTDIENMPDSMEALMFAIYYAAVVALPPEECEAMFGLPQPAVVNKYMLATQQALNNAKLLKNLDLTVLQALVILLIASRNTIDPRPLWIHCGTAIRLGQRIGLHRDGSSLGLPPFEIEMRRRLWWQIVVLDTRIAELSDAGTSMLSIPFDTHLPSNVNDSNLNPEMAQLPPERPGATDMTFCLARYEFGNFLKRSSTDFFFFEGAWAKPDGPPASLVEKDRAIDELALHLEEKYIVHCDTNITLHFLTKIFTRTAIYRMRLVAHHPRRHPDKGVSMPPEEREYLCRLSLNIVENDNLSHSNKSADKFAWYVNMNFPFPAFIYLISELRHRTRGELSDRGWTAMNEAFRNRIKYIAAKRESPMFKAISVLALKAWQARELDAVAHGEPIPEAPECITTLRSIFGDLPVKGKRSSISDPGSLQTPLSSTTHDDQMKPDLYTGMTPASEPATVSGMNSTEWSPMDWSYWDELVQNWDPQVGEGNGQSDSQ
ncbi:MAG: hypothetical protein Q9199_004024 [Rusavskia elegans]